MSTIAPDVPVDCLVACNIEIVFDETRHLGESPASGTPPAGEIRRNSASEAIRELV